MTGYAVPSCPVTPASGVFAGAWTALPVTSFSTPGGDMTEIIRPLLIILGVLAAILTIGALLIWLERRMLGVWQDRWGPNRVGPFGLLQVVADAIKLMAKEDWIPPFADKPVFILAPTIIMVTALMSFAVIPFGPHLAVADLNIGLLFFLAMSSLGAYSVVLAGWSSNSKGPGITL